MGQAALKLWDEGVVPVFGDRFEAGELVGMIAEPGSSGGRWRRGRWAVEALHDRFPSQSRAERFAAVQDEAGGLLWANPVALTLLCRDKLACQRVLEAAGVAGLPPVVSGNAELEDVLDEWGQGFLKPRSGALGVGVRHVQAGAPLPRTLPSVVPGAEDTVVLQAAVDPGPLWAGRALRVLCQREPSGAWVQCPAVLRRSRRDRVVNVARGAEVLPAEDCLSIDTLRAVAAACDAVCAALTAAPGCGRAVELGVDVVLDGDDQPWVIEVNGRPRGRLAVLAAQAPDRFGAVHGAAVARPIVTTAAWARAGVGEDGPGQPG